MADGSFDLNSDDFDKLLLEARKHVAVDVVAQGDRNFSSFRAATIKPPKPVARDGDAKFRLEVRLRDDSDVDVVPVEEVTELDDFVPDGTSIPIWDADGAFTVHACTGTSSSQMWRL